jgi:DNA-binding HxlR family transcriptional regulator
VLPEEEEKRFNEIKRSTGANFADAVTRSRNLQEAGLIPRRLEEAAPIAP